MGKIVKKKPTLSAEEKKGRRLAKVFAAFFVPRRKYEWEFYLDVASDGPFTAIYNHGFEHGYRDALKNLSR